LGDIYFDKRNYLPSGAYYDSAMTIIDENYPNYEIISQKYNSLNKLVTNLKTIETQDSLQHLAGLSKDQLDKLVTKWVEDEKKKQEEMMAGGDEGGENMSAYYRANSSRMRLTDNAGSGFYFYNTSTVSFGKKEFVKLWGDRQNEDDWRRKNKNEVTLDDTGEPVEDQLAEQSVEKEKRADDPTTPEYYKQDIPVTDSMMQVSHNKIRDALFNSGNILKNDFNDFNQSIGSFSNLNTRYPDNIYLLASWFNLWDLYKILENPDSSNYYKELITSRYPESNYAKYLINPNFFIEEAARKDSINKLYNLAFTAFKKNDFKNAGMVSRSIIAMNPDTSINSKAQFIRTIADSKDLNKTVFADSLRAYISHYPTAQPVKLAEKILSFIKEDKFSNYEQMVSTGYLNDVIKNSELLTQVAKSGNIETSKWDTENELLHYFIIAFPTQSQIDINRLKFDLANYNLDHYTTLDFEIETENLNQDNTLLIVRNFENKDAAMVYFMSIIRKPEVFKTLAGKPYLNFIASNNNYRQMLNDKSYDEYIAYFVKNYSNLTAGKFSDQELESPEALMARLKQDPNSDLKEEGEFVVVETGNSNNTPVKKEQLFTADHSVAHNVTILIHQKNAGTGFIMRDLIKYNSASHRDKRLRVVPGKMNDITLVSIASFPNAYNANEYMKQLLDKKELFTSLGTTKYETFITSDANLKKLVETGNLEEWNKFYQINYIRRAPQAPKPVETKPVETKQEEIKLSEVKAAENTPVETKQVETKLPKEESTSEKPAEVMQAVSKQDTINNRIDTPAETQQIPSEKKDTIQKTTEVISEKPAETVVVPQSTTTPEEVTQPAVQETTVAQVENIPVEESIFTVAPESGHNLIYLLPVKSPNQSLLTTYLTRLNAVKYRNDGLSITAEPLNDIMIMVIVKGLTNKEKAVTYFADTKNDQRVTMSLRNVSYKSYLISNDNLQKLKETNDIAAYQQFFEKHY
jgi:hypothetical protein